MDALLDFRHCLFFMADQLSDLKRELIFQKTTQIDC